MVPDSSTVPSPLQQIYLVGARLRQFVDPGRPAGACFGSRPSRRPPLIRVVARGQNAENPMFAAHRQ